MFESMGASNGARSGGMVAGAGGVEQGGGVLVPSRRKVGCEINCER